MNSDSTMTLDKADVGASAESSPQRDLPPEQWPSATTTWRRYCYIGRWNYAKGTMLAIVLGIAGVPFFGWQFLAVAIATAMTYVAVSCGGLFLLYGPPSRRIFERLLEMSEISSAQRALDIHFGTYRTSRELLELLPTGRLRHSPQSAER